MNKGELNNKEKQEIQGDVQKALTEAKERTKSDVKIKKFYTQTSKTSVITAILVIATIAFVGIYYYLANNPKTIFTLALNDLFDSVSKGLDENIIQGVVTINDKKVSYSSDKKGSLYHIENFTIYTENHKSYFYSKNINDKYVALNTPMLDYNSDDIIYVLDTINNVIYETVKNKKFKTSDDNIKINGEKMGVTVTSIELYADDVMADFENILNQLDNNKFYSACVRLGFSKNEVISLIDEFKLKLQQADVKQIEPRMIKVYSEAFSHNFVKLEVISDTEKIMTITKLSDNKYELYYDGFKVSLSVSKGNSFVKPNLGEAIKFSDLSSSDKQKIEDLIKVVE